MTPKHTGRAFTPGGFGNLSYSGLSRQEVERLLRIWFAWVKDKSRIHVSPHGIQLDAEIQVRRWETRPDLAVFRWRNSDTTRSAFESVREGFRTAYPDATVEMTRKSGKPRAIVQSMKADDVIAPLWAMGLVISAFRYAGIENASSFDLKTHSSVLRQPRGSSQIDLEPVLESWRRGHRIGRFIGEIARSVTPRK